MWVLVKDIVWHLDLGASFILSLLEKSLWGFVLPGYSWLVLSCGGAGPALETRIAEAQGQSGVFGGW